MTFDASTNTIDDSFYQVDSGQDIPSSHPSESVMCWTLYVDVRCAHGDVGCANGDVGCANGDVECVSE